MSLHIGRFLPLKLELIPMVLALLVARTPAPVQLVLLTAHWQIVAKLC